MGGGVEQRLADTEREGHDVQRPESLDINDDGGGQSGDGRGAGEVDEQHRSAPVQSVGECAGVKCEQQPRQPSDDGDGGEGARVACDRQGDERQRDLEHAVGQVGQGGGGDQAP